MRLLYRICVFVFVRQPLRLCYSVLCPWKMNSHIYRHVRMCVVICVVSVFYLLKRFTLTFYGSAIDLRFELSLVLFICLRLSGWRQRSHVCVLQCTYVCVRGYYNIIGYMFFMCLIIYMINMQIIDSIFKFNLNTLVISIFNPILD